MEIEKPMHAAGRHRKRFEWIFLPDGISHKGRTPPGLMAVPPAACWMGRPMFFVVLMLMLLRPAVAQVEAKQGRDSGTVHVFVALCDNASQGIAPVPAKIGNGNDAANNLYWGCSEGLKTCFRNSRAWKLIASPEPPGKYILERCVFEDKRHAVRLVADAYRGTEIKRAIRDFLEAAAGAQHQVVAWTDGPRSMEIKAGGAADLVVYIGHNGLIEFDLENLPKQRAAEPREAIVLCCKSQDYFRKHLQHAGSRPLLLTTQLMYPGSFVLEACLEGWIADEPTASLADRAAGAYARNQRISVGSARRIFTGG